MSLYLDEDSVGKTNTEMVQTPSKYQIKYIFLNFTFKI